MLSRVLSDPLFWLWACCMGGLLTWGFLQFRRRGPK